MLTQNHAAKIKVSDNIMPHGISRIGGKKVEGEEAVYKCDDSRRLHSSREPIFQTNQSNQSIQYLNGSRRNVPEATDAL